MSFGQGGHGRGPSGMGGVPFGAPGLSVVPGGGPRRPALDPDVPPDLIAILKRWHAGKKWRRDAGEPKLVPWLNLELIDVEENRVIHPVDDLGPDLDDEDLARELWEKIKSYTRGRNDGLTRHFIIRCAFSDEEGRTTFEEFSCPLMLPKDYGTDWGASSTMQSRLAMQGPYGAQRVNPHHTVQEIDMMNLALNVFREANNTIMSTMREQSDMIRGYRTQELDMMRLHREMMDDKRQQERLDWESSIKMNALKVLVDRLGVIAPPMLMKVQQWASHKLGDGKKRTPREELAFGTLRGLVKRMQVNIKKMGGDPKDPTQLYGALKMMGIDEEDEILDDIKNLLIEFEVDERTQKIMNVGDLLAPQQGGVQIPPMPRASDESNSVEVVEVKNASVEPKE